MLDLCVERRALRLALALLLIAAGSGRPAQAQGGGRTASIEQVESLDGIGMHVDSLTGLAPNQGAINGASATSTSSHVRPQIMGGKLSADSSVVFLTGSGANPFSDPWVGTGTFVACRCVVTAQHVLVEILGTVTISQTNGAGRNIFDDLENGVIVKQAWEKRRTSPKLDSIAFNASPDDIYADIAFIWTFAPNNLPALRIDHRAGYTPKTFDFTPIVYGFGGGPQWGDELTIIGYGATSVLTPWGPVGARRGTQRTGIFDAYGPKGYPTTRTIPGIMTAGLETGAVYSGTAGTLWTEYGDSGGPVLRGNSIVAIHRGSDWGLDNGTTVAPFQPWIQLQLNKFCKPRGYVGVGGSDGDPTAAAKIELTITGGAFYWKGEPGQVNEEEDTVGYCLGSLTCGASIRGDDPFYEGITISATVTPRQTNTDVVWTGGCKEGNDPNAPYTGPTCTFPVPPGAEDGQASREFTLKGSIMQTGGP